jgi:hypothetical protein
MGDKVRPESMRMLVLWFIIGIAFWFTAAWLFYLLTH